MRRALLALVAILALGAAPASAAPDPPLHDVHRVTAGDYTGLAHWRRSTSYQTVVRVIWRGPDTRWLPQTKRAVGLWNRSGRIYMLMASTCPSGRNCVYVYTKNQGTNGVLGTAVGCGSGGHLYTVTGDNCNKVIYNTAYPASAGDPNLACHELGHSLGLRHPADGSAGPCRGGYPKDIDYSNLRTTYAHRDATGPPGVPAGYGQ